MFQLSFLQLTIVNSFSHKQEEKPELRVSGTIQLREILFK
jgi:hypothetical protein